MAQQGQLAIAEAEGVFAERQALLGSALIRTGADLYCWRFCWRVFHCTGGGAAGVALEKTYDQLAASSWEGLCCSVEKARAVVRRCRQLGLIARDERRYTTGGQKANAYTIDWAGVRRWCLASAPEPAVQEVQQTGWSAVTGGMSDQGGGMSDQGGGMSDHPLRKIAFSQKPFLPGPVSGGPEAAAGGVVIERKGRWPQGCAAKLPAAVFERWPELRPYLDAEVAPLPLGRYMRESVFQPLALVHLRDPGRVTEWFRRQLSHPQPATLATEADLVLVLCSAKWAAGMDAAAVRASHQAAFKSAVLFGKWAKTEVLRHVEECIGVVERIRDWRV